MRRIALAALVMAPVLLGGCIFAVGNGDVSDERRLTRLEQRMEAAEKKLHMEQAKAAEAVKTPEAVKPPEEPKKP